MSSQAKAPVPPFTARRVAACLALALVLLWAGWQQEMLFALLGRSWNALFAALGLSGLLDRVQHGTNSEITKGSLPGMVTGSLLYVAGCLLLLHLLLRSRQRTWWVVQLYLVLFGVCLLLLVVGKVSSNVLLYRIVRRIINVIVSPLPGMVLLPVLWPRSEKIKDERFL